MSPETRTPAYLPFRPLEPDRSAQLAFAIDPGDARKPVAPYLLWSGDGAHFNRVGCEAAWLARGGLAGLCELPPQPAGSQVRLFFEVIDGERIEALRPPDHSDFVLRAGALVAELP